MKTHPYLAAASLLLTLAACTPWTADYTESEAPNNLVVNNASSRIDVRFVPGSSQLLPGDALRLRRLAATGQIAPSDRVTVAAAGGPGLAAARVSTVADQLVGYGISVGARTLAVAPNRAIIDTGRYMVTLPPCPNWSKEATVRFTNTLSSNFGCATTSNLGEMIASPADLAEGRPVGLAEGQPAASAVDRYLTDKVTLPAAVTITAAAPAAAAGGTASGGGGGAQ